MEDIYVDMKEDFYLYDIFNFFENYMLYFKMNEKKFGVMKYEFLVKLIVEFVGLCFKMYVFVCNIKDEVKVVKGIKKNVIFK